jgi:hypothetical protein
VDLYLHSPIDFHSIVLNYLSTGTTLLQDDQIKKDEMGEVCRMRKGDRKYILVTKFKETTSSDDNIKMC